METATTLADNFPAILRLDTEKSGEIPTIAKALDQGADDLLKEFNPTTTRLDYSPLFVERLLDEISQHIASCSRIRDQAQQLEVQAFRETIDIQSRQRVDAMLEAHLPLATLTEPGLISNQTTLTVSGATVSGSPGSAEPYWKTLSNLRNEQLAVSKDETARRLSKYAESGNGNNFVERFGLLKVLFDSELVTLYKKIIAASIGMREIFGIDQKMPPVTPTGYLNALVLWAQDAANAVEQRSYGIDSMTVVIPFHDYNGAAIPPPGIALMSHDQFLGARQAGSAAQIAFNITEATFSLPGANTIVKPVMRGFDLWFVDSTKKDLTVPVPGWATDTSFRASATLPPLPRPLEFSGHPTLQIPNMTVLHLAQIGVAGDVRMSRKCFNVRAC
jgi:hypothetical protein